MRGEQPGETVCHTLVLENAGLVEVVRRDFGVFCQQWRDRLDYPAVHKRSQPAEIAVNVVEGNASGQSRARLGGDFPKPGIGDIQLILGMLRFKVGEDSVPRVDPRLVLALQHHERVDDGWLHRLGRFFRLGLFCGCFAFLRHHGGGAARGQSQHACSTSYSS